MAKKNVPLEPCMFCEKSPCECDVESARKARRLAHAAKPKPKEKSDD